LTKNKLQEDTFQGNQRSKIESQNIFLGMFRVEQSKIYPFMMHSICCETCDICWKHRKSRPRIWWANLNQERHGPVQSRQNAITHHSVRRLTNVSFGRTVGTTHPYYHANSSKESQFRCQRSPPRHPCASVNIIIVIKLPIPCMRIHERHTCSRPEFGASLFKQPPNPRVTRSVRDESDSGGWRGDISASCVWSRVLRDPRLHIKLTVH
jgi:hypothetical protein